MSRPRNRRGALVAAVVALASILASCSSAATPAPTSGPGVTPAGAASPSGAASGPTRIPYLVDEQDPVGTTRVLFAMTDAKGNSIGAPNLTVTVAFYDVAKSSTTPVTTVPATFIWAIKDVRGLYEVTATFAEPGDWIAEFTSADGTLTERTQVRFQVSATSSTPAIGAKAPDTPTPTLADVGGDVKQLSTDTTPALDFYRVSVHDALAQHKPFVLVFATPAFCRSAVCGPTLDGIKAVAKTRPGMTFINVEPYKMTFTGGRLQPVPDAGGSLQATDVTNAWGLLTEPWVFLVDRNGIVRGSWSTVVTADELTAAIDAVK